MTAFNPLIQIINKGIKQNWPQYWALGITPAGWLPTGLNSICCESLSLTIQSVLHPVNCMTLQAINSQFFQENTIRNCAKPLLTVNWVILIMNMMVFSSIQTKQNKTKQNKTNKNHRFHTTLFSYKKKIRKFILFSWIYLALTYPRFKCTMIFITF